MTAWTSVAIALAAWAGIAVALAAVPSRMPLRRAPKPAPQPVDRWTPAAVDAEFQQLIPSFVTRDSFDLDASMNRRARGWVA